MAKLAHRLERWSVAVPEEEVLIQGFSLALLVKNGSTVHVAQGLSVLTMAEFWHAVLRLGKCRFNITMNKTSHIFKLLKQFPDYSNMLKHKIIRYIQQPTFHHVKDPFRFNKSVYSLPISGVQTIGSVKRTFHYSNCQKRPKLTDVRISVATT